MRRATQLPAAIVLGLAIVGLFVSSASPNRSQEQVEQTIRIGTWNIEWLGLPKNRKQIGHDHPQPAAKLADYIIASGVDILGLEEVLDNDGNAKTRTNKTMTEALQIIKQQTGQTWTHQLFSGVAGGGDLNDQLTGLAWNTTKIKQLDAPLKINVPHESEGAEIWKRHPHAVKFSLGEGKTDIVMIVLHLKANTGGSPPPKKKRELEAKTLLQQLGSIQTHFKDFDIIICGDTNVLSKQEKAIQLFTSFGFKDLNSEDEPTYISGGPFDRFFVPDQPEFAGLDQMVFDEEYLTMRNLDRQGFRKDYSDHFMAVTKVRILPDDDQ